MNAQKYSLSLIEQIVIWIHADLAPLVRLQNTNLCNGKYGWNISPFTEYETVTIPTATNKTKQM